MRVRRIESARIRIWYFRYDEVLSFELGKCVPTSRTLRLRFEGRVHRFERDIRADRTTGCIPARL